MVANCEASPASSVVAFVFYTFSRFSDLIALQKLFLLNLLSVMRQSRFSHHIPYLSFFFARQILSWSNNFLSSFFPLFPLPLIVLLVACLRLYKLPCRFVGPSVKHYEPKRLLPLANGTRLGVVVHTALFLLILLYLLSVVLFIFSSFFGS